MKKVIHKESSWCVYVLRCRNNYLYIGLTNNIEKRLGEHERGVGSKFVRSRMPFELLRTIPCKDPSEARKLEARLKRLPRAVKIDTLGLDVEPVTKICKPPEGKPKH